MMNNIGVIGYGFVGEALLEGIKKKYANRCVNYYIHDPYTTKEIKRFSLKDTCKFSNILFICLPTPTNFKLGIQDLSILYKTFKGISKFSPKGQIIVIKSTVKPGTAKKLKEMYPNLHIVSNPEFLVEKTYKEDFLNQNRIVLGGDFKDTVKVANFYLTGWPDARYFLMNNTEAEMVKYVSNVFLSVKVGFFNEIFDICNKLNISFENIRKSVCSDERIGDSHSAVPGPDGKRGFGGHCFPKDIATFVELIEDIGYDDLTRITEIVWDLNHKYRNDWNDK